MGLMILLRRGEFAKRIFAFLLVLLFLSAQILPSHVRAVSVPVGLAAVGAAVTVTAFLNACGIFPYSEGTDFVEWQEGLAELYAQFQEATGIATDMTFYAIKSFVVGQSLALQAGTWENLRSFASWLQTKFALADNQTGVQLRDWHGAVRLPSFSDTPTLDSLAASGMLLASNFSSGKRKLYAALYLPVDGVSGTIVSVKDKTGAYSQYYVLFESVYQNKDDYRVYYVSIDTASNGVRHPGVKSVVTLNGQTFYYLAFGQHYQNLVGTMGFEDVPIFADSESALAYFAEIVATGAAGAYGSGITADTTTASIPDALPEGKQFGGLAIPQIGAAPFAEVVADVIQGGVTEREQPVVTPVDVEIGTGVDIDTETGVIIENPVVIDQESAIPALSDLVSQPLVQAIAETMQTKFPFCLPFDIMRLANAFAAEPVAPRIEYAFYEPFTDRTYMITVDLSPWDEVAAVVRQLETMVLFVGFWLNFDKFNILNVILGNLS